jgi:hypothetical protein
VKNIASRKIRPRPLDVCLDEIARNVAQLPGVHTIRILDDCPTFDRSRFKDFLRQYLARGLAPRISVDNMRADSVDEELLDLLRACRTPSVCIAVESGNPEVDKGETLEKIESAARLIKKKRIPLQLCFVVGLPGATFTTEMDSLRLAKALKPEMIYWNMFQPYPGAKAREWFLEHGTIFEERDNFSLIDHNLNFTQPPTETPEFPRQERVRAWVKCVLETGSFLVTPRVLARAVRLAVRYKLASSIPAMLAAIPRRIAAYGKLAIDRARLKLGWR